MDGDRELDAKVAELVMGWEFPYSADRGLPHGIKDHWRDPHNKTIYLPDQLPGFTTDPAADYEVLKRVREKWDSERRASFSYELEQLFMRKQSREAFQCGWFIMYEPGDYSRAALALAAAKGGEGL